jgi:hypothetical protein
MATYKFLLMGPGFQCHEETLEMGPFKISAPVGAGPKAKNFREDVRKIQCALNRFTPLQGGPQEILEVDGWCGQKTLAAIHEFQMKRLGWADDRVDPDRETMRHLNTPPEGPDFVPAAMEQISRITGILTAARAALQLASLGFSSLDGGLLAGARSAAVKKLNRHFHLDRSKDPQGAIRWIDRIFLNMQTAIGYIPTGVTLFGNDPLNRSNFAYSARGGYEVMIRTTRNLQGGTPAGTIWLTRRLKSLDSEGIPYVMVHELAHYCGPVEGQPNEINDRHGYRPSPNYDRLTPEQALQTADCYSQYAFDAAGREFIHDQHVLN